jgi:hypothetical protein
LLGNETLGNDVVDANLVVENITANATNSQ